MLKKPVGRILVNTPAAFGAMGVTTDLFPSMTLGGLTAGLGITSDNVSPMNLVYMRNAAWGVREIPGPEAFDDGGTGRGQAVRAGADMPADQNAAAVRDENRKEDTLDVAGLLRAVLRQLED